MTDDIRRSLGTERARYKAAADLDDDPNLVRFPSMTLLKSSNSNSQDITAFWKALAKDCPTWASAFKRLLLCQPSSAAIERVWSMFSNTFDAGSERSPLTGYMRASTLLKYNHRSVNKDAIVVSKSPNGGGAQ